MAIQNQIILNGQISKIRKIYENKETVQIMISLFVIRRPQIADGNKRGEVKTNNVQIITKDKKIIEYLVSKKAAKGDMLEVSGVYCTLRAKKHFICPNCNKENVYEGTISFVHPICVRLSELTPKHTEIVSLTEAERHMQKKYILSILNERKSLDGNIIDVKDLGFKNGLYQIRISVHEEPSEETVRKWLLWMAEISNRIFLIGNLCNDPSYNPIENGGRVCTYQLGINRKVFIRDDDPSVRADFPWIKSLGAQADMDYEALRKGSLVYIDGSIQAREGFVVQKTCEYCGSLCSKKDSSMEIVPYSVEYLKNCIAIESDDDIDDIPEYLEMEDDEENDGYDDQNEYDEDPEPGAGEDDGSWEEPDETFVPDYRDAGWQSEDDEYGSDFDYNDYAGNGGFEGFSSVYGEGGDD